MQQNRSRAQLEFREDHSYFVVRLPVHPLAVTTMESGSHDLGAESGAESNDLLTQSDEPPTQSPTQSNDPVTPK